MQRLAERSAEATKQIGAIVKTIQTDTGDAVAAMENATRDVVDGARLSGRRRPGELAEIGASPPKPPPDRDASRPYRGAGQAATQVAER